MQINYYTHDHKSRYMLEQGDLIFYWVLLCVGIGSLLSNITAGFITEIYGFHVGFISLSFIAAIGLVTYTFTLQETRLLSGKLLVILLMFEFNYISLPVWIDMRYNPMIRI